MHILVFYLKISFLDCNRGPEPPFKMSDDDCTSDDEVHDLLLATQQEPPPNRTENCRRLLRQYGAHEQGNPSYNIQRIRIEKTMCI